MIANKTHVVTRSPLRKAAQNSHLRPAKQFKIHKEHFIAAFTPEHIPTFAAKQTLGDKLNPLYQRSMSRFLGLPRDTLWVQIVVNTLPFDAVRRRACRYWLEAALSEAFRNANFDSNTILWAGKRAEMMKRQNQHPRATSRGSVTGTLEIWAKKGLLCADRGQLQQHMHFIVKHLKRLKGVERASLFSSKLL